MNMSKLFSMQKELDSHIKNNHHLQNENLFDKKILALLVELGELANETRCFKFWSLKQPAPIEKILEEYVDGLHFILSLGIEKGFENKEISKGTDHPQETTEQFLNVYNQISKFKLDSSYSNYKELFHSYLALGEQLGFSLEDMEHAYFQKNEVNYERQETGY